MGSFGTASAVASHQPAAAGVSLRDSGVLVLKARSGPSVLCDEASVRTYLNSERYCLVHLTMDVSASNKHFGQVTSWLAIIGLLHTDSTRNVPRVVAAGWTSSG
jgi:hypothetical protein